MKFGKVKFIQIDAGIAGGILAGKEIAEYAERNDIKYVNHTFTSHLQLSSSIQAFTGLVNSNLAEYPMQLKSLAWDITENHILMNNDGLINIPSDIGHGMIINEDALKDYKVDVEIKINNRQVF